MKWLTHILILILLAGCGGAVKKSWTNFRAHYNTYYNAEKSFESGKNQVLSQNISIDPSNPVRVHRELPQAGAADLKNTIDKGAQIIRNFADSKWTDNALFLMGKSYYYRKEFYLALQKFEELYKVTKDAHLKQKSTIWKGRTLLDLRQHGEGISFLQEQLSVLEGKWEPELKAELRVLIAEHHAMLGNWQQAHDELKPSVQELAKRSLKMRGYFLFAQMLDRLGKYNQAYVVFDRVTSIYTDYQYSYWAELFKGQIARKTGSIDQAFFIFTGMSRDDKNFDRMDEINYQIAKTQQERGIIRDAEEGYKRVLRSTISQAGPEVRSKTYYQLGIIYSEHYNAYETAAAYFDSASTVSVSSSSLQDGETGSLASAYGNYALLKSREQRVDSLLDLGSLSDQQLDSTLQVIRNDRIEQLTSDAQSNQNTLSNVVQGSGENGDNLNQTNDFGFLNYRNPQLVSSAGSDFNTIWGNRPLVDNWRRAEAVQGVASNTDATQNTEPNVGASTGRLSDKDLGIDVSQIPRTEVQKVELQKEKASIQYELGNLFFLTLNMPDSVEAYFSNVINNNYADESLIARTKYALHEMYDADGQAEKASQIAQQILKDYPDTIYARRITKQKDLQNAPIAERDSAQQLLQQFRAIEQSEDSAMAKPHKYRALALANDSSKLAPHIHYRALQGYVNHAKRNANSATYNSYFIFDSTATVATRSGAHPFTGIYWDSVRVLVDEHINTFKDQPYTQQLNKLEEVLGTNSKSETNPRCSELGISPRIKPDMETFLDDVTLPQELQNKRLSGTITYLITIARNGAVQSFELESASTLEALERAYSKAIENSLGFYPIEFERDIQSIKCSVSFPVSN